ncbi:WYL domain-containing protein [Cupriavidus taiwanensis]|uniref:WCX domain-containing protein n=1 Tax=Cupriavidus taiwanensis TaxID=164546 RepID=A0A7Z7JFC9_9BURK|nr:WYL domain-containing protein [Cupriavidus taiwanensis]SOZ17168.1 conserved hypothetical protein [Cupriavidus taiwanensis]SOZ96522.1 conserved hypothetical protein [Cupriavidus taiwanensis]SPC25551.1 conserved hypothetical protein [Cupriavidus taiwanensis]
MEFLAQTPVEVVLRVREDKHEHAFRSLKLADNQTVEDEPGGFLLRAIVAPSVPFRNLLMEKSASVEVVSPPALRDEIHNQLRIALSRYG